MIFFRKPMSTTRTRVFPSSGTFKWSQIGNIRFAVVKPRGQAFLGSCSRNATTQWEMSMAHLRFLNPPALSKPPTYSHVVEITGPGKIIYIAGQLGLGVDGRLVGESGDFRAQAKQTFENLKGALAAVGATFDQVVKLNSYLTDITHLAILREVRDEFINTKAPPASTTLQISRLAHERALIEIEAVAALPLTA